MSHTSPILVLGAGGKTGRRLASLLQSSGQPVRLARRVPTGPDDIGFDWTNRDQAIAAFEGVEAAYLVAPTDRLDHAEVMIPVLEAALKGGTRRLVLLSAAVLPQGGPMMGQVHDFLAHQAPQWAVLRPSWFMQNLAEARHRQTIDEEGLLYSATGEGQVAFIDAADIARVAHRALTSDEPLNRDMILTGPQSLTYGQVAEHLARHLGKPVQHQSLTTAQLAFRFEAQGPPLAYAQTLAAMDQAIADGPPETVTDEVLRVTGVAPRSLADCLASDPDFARA